MAIKINGTTIITDTGLVDWAYIDDRPWVAGDTGPQGDTGATGVTGGTGAVGDKGRDRTRIQYYQTYQVNCNCNCSDTCFLPDQMVRMADGRSLKISEIDAGDYVVSADGTPTVVVGLYRPVLNDRTLFAIGGWAIMTGDHLILGEHGWAAVDPERFKRRIDKRVPITNLKGDVVGEVLNSKKMVVDKLVPDTRLRLVDGTTSRTGAIKALPHYGPSTQLYTLVTESGSFVLVSGAVVDGMPQ